VLRHRAFGHFVSGAPPNRPERLPSIGGDGIETVAFKTPASSSDFCAREAFSTVWTALAPAATSQMPLAVKLDQPQEGARNFKSLGLLTKSL
jgi:hypothetical protein